MNLTGKAFRFNSDDCIYVINDYGKAKGLLYVAMLDTRKLVFERRHIRRMAVICYDNENKLTGIVEEITVEQFKEKLNELFEKTISEETTLEEG